MESRSYDIDVKSWREGTATNTSLTAPARETIVLPEKEERAPRQQSEPGIRSVSGPVRVMLLAWAVTLALGVFFALRQPVWSRVDEAQHFHYVQYLYEERTLPVEGSTFISPEVVDVSLQADQWGWRPAGTTSAPRYTDPGEWTTVPAGLEGQQREKWVRWNMWRFNYEAMQPPLYYAVNVPLFAALPDDPFVQLYAMRILAALLAATVIPITYLVAREAFPDSRLVLYGAPLSVMLVQGYMLNMSQVTNDALAAPLAGAAILALLRLISRGVTWKRTLLAGALIGASLLTKMTTIFLIPVALTAYGLILAYRRGRPHRTIIHALVAVSLPLAIMTPWIVSNLVRYGDATGVSAARPLMSSFFMSPTISIETLRISELWSTFWFGEPVWPELPFTLWRFTIFGFFVAVSAAVIGLVYYFGWGRKEVRGVRPHILFLLFTFVIGFAVNLVVPFGSGIGGVPGRYLYPLLPVIAFLIVFGIDRLLRRERAVFFAELLLVWLVFFETVSLLAWIKSH